MEKFLAYTTETVLESEAAAVVCDERWARQK